jgi:CRISPR-associated endonuclease Csy4
MQHYIDIKILPDPEFNATTLINALFAKLHRGLVTINAKDIGVSFPRVDKTLGDKLRLHGTIESLEKLMRLNWLKGLTDYTDISETKAVPNDCRYRIVKRVHSKSNVERLYRRSVKKGWLTEEEAAERALERKNQYLTLPYIQLTSNSSKHKFRLFIEHGELIDTPQAGEFSSYGLSTSATIPWF